MNVLLVGGTGVLSSAVTYEALKQGYHVTMINRGSKSIPNGVELIKSDKNNIEYINSKLEGRTFDAVIDFLSISDEETARSFNLYHKFTRQYFYISSCAVYNTASKNTPFNEDDEKGLKIWPYSLHKWQSEQHIIEMAKERGCNYTIIRPCVTYGDTRIPYGIMPEYGFHWTLCARIIAGKPIIRWNGGINRCNITRVEDFAIGVVGLIGKKDAFNQAFNVCGDDMPSFNDVLDVLSKHLNKEIQVIDLPSDYYAQEMPDYAGEILGGRSIDSLNSNLKIKKIVPEFTQSIDLFNGIGQTLKAYKDNNYQKGIDWRFDACTDRIVKKWCKKERIHSFDRSTIFVDYLNNATLFDKYIYWVEKNKDIYIIKLIEDIRLFVRKVTLIIKRKLLN